jgi:nucleotide-binding universal stress UspA family protein
MAHVSHKLSNSLEGALAGGGDAATSPLYVFGPFLRLIAVAGVASVTFGASVWLVVFTIAVVSAMYRLVMTWITDGSGGSGLSEEEFGGWAVKVNAGITFIEYTLTFLVSTAAMVTLVADRFPLLNMTLFGIQYRAFVAVALSLLTGWLVNRGPKAAARAFGPATAGVLVLLWAMVIATIWRLGLHLPRFDLRAFTPGYLHFTLAGYTRILAVMTGIEVFANLVAAYSGTPQEKSRKAFGSLLIIMGTTSVTMLVVGPAIFALSDPTQGQVSVFTQAMDQLLPDPLPYLGTLVGIAVLLSASAASAQGLQNLALGLTSRHYIPTALGRHNRFGVADKPVWIEVGLVSLCFLAFGTHEETYLALYAAGVFILLSMSGWAASKRLFGKLRTGFAATHLFTLLGAAVAALLTSAATLIIFAERFLEGAWTYFLLIPILYALFTYSRRRLGAPSPTQEQLGGLEAAMLGGFGLGQSTARQASGPRIVRPAPAERLPALPGAERLQMAPLALERILIPLDGSALAEQALALAETLGRACRASLTLVSVLQARGGSRLWPLAQARRWSAEAERLRRRYYLDRLAAEAHAHGNSLEVDALIGTGREADAINSLVCQVGADLVVMSTIGHSGLKRVLLGNVASEMVQLASKPILLVRPSSNGNGPARQFKKLLVALDGSPFAERTLPYATALASPFGSQILLLSVPEVPEAWLYGAMGEVVEGLRADAEARLCQYLQRITRSLGQAGFEAQALVTGSGPARTIVALSESEAADMILLATHGRGGVDRLLVGSVADQVSQHARCPVLLVPIHEQQSVSTDCAPPPESALASPADRAGRDSGTLAK